MVRDEHNWHSGGRRNRFPSGSCKRKAAKEDEVKYKNTSLRNTLAELKSGREIADMGVVSVSSWRHRVDLSELEAVVLFRNFARKQYLAVLAQLASCIVSMVGSGASTGEDPFAKAKGLILDMIANPQVGAVAVIPKKPFARKSW